VHLWLRSTAQGHTGMGNRKSRIRPPQTNEVFHRPDSPMTASNRGMKGLDRGKCRETKASVGPRGSWQAQEREMFWPQDDRACMCQRSVQRVISVGPESRKVLGNKEANGFIAIQYKAHCGHKTRLVPSGCIHRDDFAPRSSLCHLATMA
jgi:hypothetical protein